MVIVTIDGLRAGDVGPGLTPTLARLAAQGTSSPDARTVVPSHTLPAHTSLLSGVTPARHGVTWNTDLRRTVGPVPVPTVLDLASEAGMRVSAFFAKRKLGHLHRPGPGRWTLLPRDLLVHGSERTVLEVRAHLRHRLPDLMVVHLAEPDVAGHLFGWGRAPYRWGVRRADRAVAAIEHLVQEAAGDRGMVLVVTADHGGTGQHHGDAEETDLRIPWLVAGPGISRTEVRGVRIHDTAPTVLCLLGLPVPAGWEGRVVEEALSRGCHQRVASPRTSMWTKGPR